MVLFLDSESNLKILDGELYVSKLGFLKFAFLKVSVVINRFFLKLDRIVTWLLLLFPCEVEASPIKLCPEDGNSLMALSWSFRIFSYSTKKGKINTLVGRGRFGIFLGNCDGTSYLTASSIYTIQHSSLKRNACCSERQKKNLSWSAVPDSGFFGTYIRIERTVVLGYLAVMIALFFLMESGSVSTLLQSVRK